MHALLLQQQQQWLLAVQLPLHTCLTIIAHYHLALHSHHLLHVMNSPLVLPHLILLQLLLCNNTITIATTPPHPTILPCLLMLSTSHLLTFLTHPPPRNNFNLPSIILPPIIIHPSASPLPCPSLPPFFVCLCFHLHRTYVYLPFSFFFLLFPVQSLLKTLSHTYTLAIKTTISSSHLPYNLLMTTHTYKKTTNNVHQHFSPPHWKHFFMQTRLQKPNIKNLVYSPPSA